MCSWLRGSCWTAGSFIWAEMCSSGVEHLLPGVPHLSKHLLNALQAASGAGAMREVKLRLPSTKSWAEQWQLQKAEAAGVVCTGGSLGSFFLSLSYLQVCRYYNLQNVTQILTGCFHCPGFRAEMQRISPAGTQHHWSQIMVFHSTSRLIIQMFSFSLTFQSLITGRLFFT